MLAAFAAALAATVDWVALPIAAYNSDDGFAGGAVVRVQWLGDRQPYGAMLGAQVLFSTAGVQSHYLSLDVPGLLGTGVRLRLAAAFRKEVSAPYYGIGNDSSDALTDHPGLAGDHPFAYARKYPEGIVAVTIPLADAALRLSTFARYLRLSVDPYAGSLLAQERPLGVEGGQELSYGVGLLLDRRDKEVAPSGGYVLEAALRGAVSGVASTYSYGGATVRALGFVPVGERIVLAARLEGDLLTPGAPLFELSRFGGVDPIEGVGGERSVRGIPRARYIGRAKALASGELRVRMLDPRILDRAASMSLVAFYDTGRVWELRGHDGSFFDFHSGVGGGLRVDRKNTVLRFEVGTSHDRAFNLYVTLGSSF